MRKHKHFKLELKDWSKKHIGNAMINCLKMPKKVEYVEERFLSNPNNYGLNSSMHHSATAKGKIIVVQLEILKKVSLKRMTS